MTMPTTFRALTPRHGAFYLVAAFTFLAASLSGRTLQAQAPAALEHKADINVWGGFNYTYPDYGPDQYRDKGIAFGGVYQRYLYLGHIPLSLGLEARYNHVTGLVVNEHGWAGGLRVAPSRYLLHRVQPYIDFELGMSNIVLVHPTNPDYTHDNGYTINYGGGVDIAIMRGFSFKADGQIQNWTLGKNYTLAPVAITLGVSYRIPFKPWTGR